MWRLAVADFPAAWSVSQFMNAWPSNSTLYPLFHPPSASHCLKLEAIRLTTPRHASAPAHEVIGAL